MSEPSGTQYGGFWVRFLALLADSAIVFLLSAALLIGAGIALGPEGLAPAVLAVWALGFLYWPVMHASRGQATFGKAIVGLKVARLNGRRISILRSLWRELMKILSAAVLMLGYLMAAFTPRKQGLHDLMAATYVVREGPSRVVAALAVAVAGFAVPVVVGPMVGAAAVLSSVMSMAEGVVGEPVKLTASPVMPAKPKPAPKHQVVAKAAPAPVAPKPEPKPEPVAPGQAAAAPTAPTPKPEPKPEPVALAPAAPVPAVEPAKPKPVTAKREAAATKPKVAPAKAGPVLTTAVARAPKPAPVPASPPKLASGPKYNDIMTAVLYRDAEAVSELLKLGKWPDKPDSRGATPLMIAARLGDVRTAETLLRGGADGRLAVSVAEERADAEMIQLLKRYNSR